MAVCSVISSANSWSVTFVEQSPWPSAWSRRSRKDFPSRPQRCERRGRGERWPDRSHCEGEKKNFVRDISFKTSLLQQIINCYCLNRALSIFISKAVWHFKPLIGFLPPCPVRGEQDDSMCWWTPPCWLYRSEELIVSQGLFCSDILNKWQHSWLRQYMFIPSQIWSPILHRSASPCRCCQTSCPY